MAPQETLPVLDLQRFASGDRAGFLSQLRDAARGVGFFYLRGHGIDTDLTAEVLALARQFFALPEQERPASA